MSGGMPYGWGRVPFGADDRLPWRNLPFPEDEYEQRIERLRARMADAELDCLLVLGTAADTSDIRYLTNFQDLYGGHTVVVVRHEGEIVMVTNAIMHGEPMHSGIPDAWPRDVRAAASPRTVTGNALAKTLEAHVSDAITELPDDATIGLAGDWSEAMLERMGLASRGGRLIANVRLVAELRAIKSPREVDLLRRTAAIGDAGLTAAMEEVRPGVTEYDVAAAANEAMFRAGAEHPSFSIAVVAGVRSGLKHMAPTDYVVAPGDMVYVDAGARFMGYLSDNSRQTVCGEPSAEQLRFMETQVAIVERVTAGVRPGAVIGELAKVAQEMADDGGYGDCLYFRGHGIGTGFGEAPALAPNSPRTFEAGMVFCLEPMLVKLNFGTACWEDMWHVTGDGIERLNQNSYRFWEHPAS
jgi:Xaa-Pro aminopeptidase